MKTRNYKVKFCEKSCKGSDKKWMRACVETHKHISSQMGQILVKQAGEAVIISHCMLNSRNSTEAGVGNNLSSQCGREAQASAM